MPNVKIILTDDHRFLETIVAQERVKDLFWETSRNVFKVDLKMNISVADNEIIGLYII